MVILKFSSKFSYFNQNQSSKITFFCSTLYNNDDYIFSSTGSVLTTVWSHLYDAMMMMS